MFVSVRDDVVLHGGFRSIAEGLKAMEVDSVELHVERDLSVQSFTTPQQRHDLSSSRGLIDLEREASRTGARISAFLLANDFGREDAREQIEWMVQAIRIAHRLGVSAIRVDAVVSGWETMGIENATHLFAEHIKQVLEATDDTDVQLGIENHGTLGNRPEFLQALFEAVGSPRLGLTLDTGNFYWFGYPLSRVYEIIGQFAPKTKHTHVKNIAYPPETREQHRPVGYEYGRYVCPIYEGDIDHSVIIKTLKEVGYNGDLCIEDESLGKFAPEERRLVLCRDAEYLKALIASS